MNKTPLILSLVVLPVLLVLVLLPVLVWQEPLDTMDILLLVLVPLLLLATIRLNVVQGRFAKVNGLLFDHCDPEAYIEQTRQLLDKAEQRRQAANIQVLRVNLNAGLQAAGRYDEALAMMPDASQIGDNRIGRLLRVVYHHNNFEALVKLGNIGQAELALAWLNDALGELKTNRKQAEHLRLLSRMDAAMLGMVQGRFDGADLVFRECADKAQNIYQRVSATLELGRVYAHFGWTDYARGAYEFVVANGNKLHAVAEAREELAKLFA